MTAEAITTPTASRFARLVLGAIHREYPNKLDHVLDGAESVLSPRRLHPAFFGCFDWHSAVHGHWLLARLNRLFPDLPEAATIRAALDASLTPGNIAGEVAYLARPNTGTFERTYGWAWLLKLAEELRRAGHGAAAWSDALAPLVAEFVRRYLDYLPRAHYPIRAGTHANSAFGLAFVHDYASAVGHGALRALVERTAAGFFGQDRDYPAHLEPGGADFFSPALMEGDLMRRVLPAARFAVWFGEFLPRLRAGRGPKHSGNLAPAPDPLFAPAEVHDRTDWQSVHLDGLNLSRAWSMRNIAGALPAASSEARSLMDSAAKHTAASLPHVCSGNYAGEHWLATFAVLALTGDR